MRRALLRSLINNDFHDVAWHVFRMRLLTSTHYEIHYITEVLRGLAVVPLTLELDRSLIGCNCLEFLFLFHNLMNLMFIATRIKRFDWWSLGGGSFILLSMGGRVPGVFPLSTLAQQKNFKKKFRGTDPKTNPPKLT